jgi:hypothetical protein
MIVKNLTKRALIFNYSLGKVVLLTGENKVKDELIKLMKKDSTVDFFIKEKQIEIVEDKKAKTFDKDNDGDIDFKDISAADLIEEIKTIDNISILEDILSKNTRKSVIKAVEKQIALVNDIKE